jgi:UDPglucose 6-dehydrogenase
MKITIFGLGYVGLVTGACFADVGNDVLCVDIDAYRVNMLKEGAIPVHEPGLDDLVKRNRYSGRLRFTTDLVIGVSHGLFQFITVGTMPNEDGSANLQHVFTVAYTIGQHLNAYRIVVNKSTVPVGTADIVSNTIAAALKKRRLDIPFSVVSNPEFLKEGTAIKDFMRPDRIIIGCDDNSATLQLRTLYGPFNRSRNRLIEMDVRSAEMTKYAANAMLATKISFMNEMANIAERLGADIEQVRIGIGADPRIGYHFIYPGCGYGGSCLPKDLKALEYLSRSIGYEPTLIKAVEVVNEHQKMVIFTKILHHFSGKLHGRIFGLWGLAFKPGTDDIREAPSRSLLEALWREGCRVRAYDPKAIKEAKRVYGERSDFQLCNQPMDVLPDADALIIATEWSLFRSPNFEMIRQQLRTPIIFDGRNLYNPDHMHQLGFVYYAIGRGKIS